MRILDSRTAQSDYDVGKAADVCAVRGEDIG